MSAQLDVVIQAQYNHTWLELPNRGPRYFFLYSHLGRLDIPPTARRSGAQSIPASGCRLPPASPRRRPETEGGCPTLATTRTRGGPRGAPKRPCGPGPPELLIRWGTRDTRGYPRTRALWEADPRAKSPVARWAGLPPRFSG